MYQTWSRRPRRCCCVTCPWWRGWAGWRRPGTRCGCCCGRGSGAAARGTLPTLNRNRGKILLDSYIPALITMYIPPRGWMTCRLLKLKSKLWRLLTAILSSVVLVTDFILLWLKFSLFSFLNSTKSSMLKIKPCHLLIVKWSCISCI